LPPDEFPDGPEFSRDLEARPSLDTVIECDESNATVRDFIEHLSNESLDG